MTADVQQELEAVALAELGWHSTAEAVATALLPTVQRLIADAEKRTAAAAIAAAAGRFADAEKQAKARGLREAEAAVRWVYDLQCPVMPPDQYVAAGAHVAHLWWQKVLGGALNDLRDRAAALDPS